MTTCARAASRRSVSPTACAVRPPIPASISSKTIVSPPPTAAIASAIRDSSPPDAVSATGAERQAGVRADKEPDLVGARRPRLGARVSSARNSPSPRPTPRELGGDRLRERRRGVAPRRPKLAVQPVDLGLCRRERLGRRAHGIVAVGDARRARAGAAAARSSSSS